MFIRNDLIIYYFYFQVIPSGTFLSTWKRTHVEIAKNKILTFIGLFGFCVVCLPLAASRIFCHDVCLILIWLKINLK